MGLFKYNLLFFGLLLITNSCSKKALEGHYYNFKDLQGSGAVRNLKLNKDSTFDYSESFFFTYKPGQFVEQHIPSRDFVGKGKYEVNGKNLTLIFTPKIRKIKRIEVVPILDDKERKKLNLHYSVGAGSCRIIFQFDEHSFHFNTEDGFPTILIANHQSVFGWVLTGKIGNNGNGEIVDEGRLDLNESMFPAKINLDFGELAGYFYSSMPVEKYKDYQSLPDESKDQKFVERNRGFDPGYSCGFFDETINIEKPGNYLVKLYCYDDQTKDQVINGKRVYIIKKFLGSVKIGYMKKTKKANIK